MIAFSFHAFSFLRSEILTTRPSALRCLYVCLSYVPNSVYQKEASFLLKKNIAQWSRRSRSDKVLVQWTASSGDWVKSTLQSLLQAFASKHYAMLPFNFNFNFLFVESSARLLKNIFSLLFILSLFGLFGFFFLLRLLLLSHVYFSCAQTCFLM